MSTLNPNGVSEDAPPVFHLLSEDGTEFIAQIQNVVSASWTDELNGAGELSLSVEWNREVSFQNLAQDSSVMSEIVIDRIVEVEYNGATFRYIIDSIEQVFVSAASGMSTLQISAVGLLSILDNSLVYPQTSLADYGDDSRAFDFRSADGNWLNALPWQSPIGLKWATDKQNKVTARAGSPAKWPDPKAEWIWETNPALPVPGGTTNWFRTTFTIDDPEKVKIFASADNTIEMYLNGVQLFDEGKSENNGAATWTRVLTNTINLPAGTHVLAAKVRNARPWSADSLTMKKDTGEIGLSSHGFKNGTRFRITKSSGKYRNSDPFTDNQSVFVVGSTANAFFVSDSLGGDKLKPGKDFKIDLRLVKDNLAGLLCTVIKVNPGGKLASVISRTSPTSWDVCTVEPEFYPARILKTLVQEGKQHGVWLFDKVSFDFTDYVGSDGKDWKRRVANDWEVGTSVYDVMSDLCELGVDFRMTENFELQAFEFMGGNKSAEAWFANGFNLLEFRVGYGIEDRATTALIRTKDGWTEASNYDYVATDDGSPQRIETFFEIDGTKSERAARRIAKRRLGKGATVAITTNARGWANTSTSTARVVNTDLIAFGREYEIGDVVLVDGTYARVLAADFNWGNDGIVIDLELELWRGAYKTTYAA